MQLKEICELIKVDKEVQQQFNMIKSQIVGASEEEILHYLFRGLYRIPENQRDLSNTPLFRAAALVRNTTDIRSWADIQKKVTNLRTRGSIRRAFNTFRWIRDLSPTKKGGRETSHIPTSQEEIEKFKNQITERIDKIEENMNKHIERIINKLEELETLLLQSKELENRIKSLFTHHSHRDNGDCVIPMKFLD